MRALIIPNDPISAYLEKGEIVERYYNPDNIFDEVDIVSLSDSDVEPKSAQKLVGAAKLNMIAAGDISLNRVLFHRSYADEIARRLDVKGEDVIIAHNSSIGGYLAARLGTIFNVPVIISMHTNPDKDIRAHIRWRDAKRKFFWRYSSFFLENYALHHASKVVCAYKFISEYLLARGVASDKIEILYHRINLGQFKRNRPITGPRGNEELRMLWVGRIFERKNPENIIRAVKNLRAKLTLIGDGPYLEKAACAAQTAGVRNRVDFIKSVPNADIDRFYKDAHIFACANDYGGISKPVMEAMAASLPVVMKRPLWEERPELIEDAAILTDGTAGGFEEAFRYLSKDANRMAEIGEKAFRKITSIGDLMSEKREADIIVRVINQT